MAGGGFIKRISVNNKITLNSCIKCQCRPFSCHLSHGCVDPALQCSWHVFWSKWCQQLRAAQQWVNKSRLLMLVKNQISIKTADLWGSLVSFISVFTPLPTHICIHKTQIESFFMWRHQLYIHMFDITWWYFVFIKTNYMK